MLRNLLVTRSADFVEGNEDERLGEHAKRQIAAEARRECEQQQRLRNEGDRREDVAGERSRLGEVERIEEGREVVARVLAR